LNVYDGLRETTNRATENSIWVVGQIEPNSLQFKISLEEYLRNPDDNVKVSNLKVTTGILMSRMDIVHVHVLENRLALREELIDNYMSIFSLKPKLLNIVEAENNAELLKASLAIQGDLEMFIERIRAFAVKTMRLAADKSASERKKLWNMVNGTFLVSFILITLLVFSLLVMIVSWKRMIETRAKEADARESLQKTYDLSSEGILIVDRMARILTVNPAATKMLDLVEEDLNNENFLNDVFIDFEDPRKFTWNILTKGQHDDIVIEHGMTYRTTTRARRKDGSFLDLDVLTARDKDSRGKSVMVLFLRDVTQQIAREKELRETRDQAVRAVESRIRFFAAMSHEMRTPISGAIAAIDAISVRTNPNPDQKRLLGIAQKSALGALDQINNILDLAWVERGDFQLDIEEFNYVEVIEDAVDQFRPLAQSVGTNFELELDDQDAAFVKGPLRVFMRPINNLLGNAIKHTQNGLITVRASHFNGKVRVEVEDTGSGISEYDREKIFEPFIMGSSEHGVTHQGSGLGLPIAKRAVERMGGEMGFSSKVDYGSLFWFTCSLQSEAPRKPFEPEDVKEAPRSLPKTGLPEHEVLLVEDDDVSRILAREMLEFNGLTVTIAKNGKEALEIASKTFFPTILMDVNMPIMDGVTSTMNIRKSGASRKARIVGVTAFGAPDEVERFLISGMDRVITKPLTNQNIHELFLDIQKSDTIGVGSIIGEEKLSFAMDSLRTEVMALVKGLKSLDDTIGANSLKDDAHRIKGLAALLQLSDLAGLIGVVETYLSSDRSIEARSLVSAIEMKLEEKC